MSFGNPSEHYNKTINDIIQYVFYFVFFYATGFYVDVAISARLQYALPIGIVMNIVLLTAIFFITKNFYSPTRRFFLSYFYVSTFGVLYTYVYGVKALEKYKVYETQSNLINYAHHLSRGQIYLFLAILTIVTFLILKIKSKYRMSTTSANPTIKTDEK